MLRFIAQSVERLHCIISLLQVQVRYIRICVVFIFASEGSLACEKLECENSDRPMINLIIVGLLVNQFRRHIVHCPAKSRPSLVNRVRGPAKVAQFDLH